MPTETALKLMQERNNSLCECCGVTPAEEAHHCLYRRDLKNKAAGKVLNETYNLQLVCKECHSRVAKHHANKVRFWRMQCARYGKDRMLDWHKRLPYKVKEMEYC